MFDDETVDWEMALRIARKVGKGEPFAESYHWAPLVADFDRLTAVAEARVSETTGLVSTAGPARARVVKRSEWAEANVESFQRLLRPLTEKLGSQSSFGSVGRQVAGLEVGTLLGWMSTRVLGQYDLLIAEDDHPDDQDLVYYVGPNVLSLERRFAFPPEEFRLWLALHECTHRAQFTGVPWLREHFLALVEQVLDSVDHDPKRVARALRQITEDLRSGRKPLDEGGLAAALATPAQKKILDQIGGMMSLLEGHGDVTMDRAGAELIPAADRFGRVLRQRRESASGIVKLLQRLIGLEAKLAQYAQGEKFIAEVERVGGPELLERAWQGSSWLPTLAEIREPTSWIERVRLSDALVG